MQDDDEWDDYRENKKDYTGLKIETLVIEDPEKPVVEEETEVISLAFSVCFHQDTVMSGQRERRGSEEGGVRPLEQEGRGEEQLQRGGVPRGGEQAAARGGAGAAQRGGRSLRPSGHAQQRRWSSTAQCRAQEAAH